MTARNQMAAAFDFRIGIAKDRLDKMVADHLSSGPVVEQFRAGCPKNQTRSQALS